MDPDGVQEPGVGEKGVGVSFLKVGNRGGRVVRGWSRSFLADICGIGLSGNQEPYLSQGPMHVLVFITGEILGPTKCYP